MKKISSILFSLGLIISFLVGILHFFAPYAAAWYSYIPNAPREIYASIDYINFFFSFLLAGLSLILLFFKKKIFEGSKEVLIFYVFIVFTWLFRVLITIIIPWPTSLQKWLILAFLTEFTIIFIPAIYLLNFHRPFHANMKKNKESIEGLE